MEQNVECLCAGEDSRRITRKNAVSAGVEMFTKRSLVGLDIGSQEIKAVEMVSLPGKCI